MAATVVQSRKFISDKIRWWFVGLLCVAAIFSEIYFTHLADWIRYSGLLFVVLVGLAIGYSTDTGNAIWALMKATPAEIRKVVWPSRQETVQTTMIVLLIVVITSVLIWVMDSSLMWAIGKLN